MRWILDARTVNNHFPGIGRYTFNLARAMQPLLADDEELILLRDPRQETVWELGELVDQNVRLLDVSISPFEFGQQRQLPRLFRDWQADLYHSPYYLFPYRPGLPTLVTLHDLIPKRYPQYFTAPQRLIFALTVQLALRTADAVRPIGFHQGMLLRGRQPPHVGGNRRARQRAALLQVIRLVGKPLQGEAAGGQQLVELGDAEAGAAGSEPVGEKIVRPHGGVGSQLIPGPQQIPGL
jgi:hypothetical protein